MYKYVIRHLGAADGALIIGKHCHLEHIEHFSISGDVNPGHRRSEAEEAEEGHTGHTPSHLCHCFLPTDVRCFVSMSRNMICVKTTPCPAPVLPVCEWTGALKEWQDA